MRHGVCWCTGSRQLHCRPSETGCRRRAYRDVFTACRQCSCGLSSPFPVCISSVREPRPLIPEHAVNPSLGARARPSGPRTVPESIAGARGMSDTVEAVGRCGMACVGALAAGGCIADRRRQDVDDERTGTYSQRVGNAAAGCPPRLPFEISPVRESTSGARGMSDTVWAFSSPAEYPPSIHSPALPAPHEALRWRCFPTARFAHGRENRVSPDMDAL